MKTAKEQLAEAFDSLKSKRVSKYRNVKTEYDGVLYDSKKEAAYARLLDTMRKATHPSDRVYRVERQVPFPVVLNGKKICVYRADFVVTYADGREQVIDVKGMKTAIYRLKKKLVEAQYGFEIHEE